MYKIISYILVKLLRIDDERHSSHHYFCDECSDYLNNQPGFDESEGEWECDICTCKNNLKEQKIVDRIYKIMTIVAIIGMGALIVLRINGII